MIDEVVKCQFRLSHLLLWITLLSMLMAINIRMYHAAPALVGMVFFIHAIINTTSLAGCLLLVSLSWNRRIVYAPGHWFLFGDGFRIIGVELAMVYGHVSGSRDVSIVLSWVTVHDRVYVAIGLIYAMVGVYYAWITRRVLHWKWKMSCVLTSLGLLGMGLTVVNTGTMWQYRLLDGLTSVSAVSAVFPMIIVFALCVASILDAMNGVRRDLLHFCGIGVICCTGVLWVFWMGAPRIPAF